MARRLPPRCPAFSGRTPIGKDLRMYFCHQMSAMWHHMHHMEKTVKETRAWVHRLSLEGGVAGANHVAGAAVQ